MHRVRQGDATNPDVQDSVHGIRTVEGLQHAAYVDQTVDRHLGQNAEQNTDRNVDDTAAHAPLIPACRRLTPLLDFAAEVDRLYASPQSRLTLHDGGRQWMVEQAGFSDTVVCNRLPDLGRYGRASDEENLAFQIKRDFRLRSLNTTAL